MAAATLESEIATNRIRGRDDDHNAKSTGDATDGAGGPQLLPGFRDGATDMQELVGQLAESIADEIMGAEADEVAGKPGWYHQSTNPGTANQLSWYRA